MASIAGFVETLGGLTGLMLAGEHDLAMHAAHPEVEWQRRCVPNQWALLQYAHAGLKAAGSKVGPGHNDAWLVLVHSS